MNEHFVDTHVGKAVNPQRLRFSGRYLRDGQGFNQGALAVQISAQSLDFRLEIDRRRCHRPRISPRIGRILGRQRRA